MSVFTYSYQQNNPIEFNPEELHKGFSYEAGIINDQFVNLQGYLSIPISMRSIIHKFCNLSATWKLNANGKSFVRDIVLDLSYQEIIGMGSVVVPFILEDLKEEPNHWFWALRAITGVDPIKIKHRGNIDLMTKDWLEWGKVNGFI